MHSPTTEAESFDFGGACLSNMAEPREVKEGWHKHFCPGPCLPKWLVLHSSPCTFWYFLIRSHDLRGMLSGNLWIPQGAVHRLLHIYPTCRMNLLEQDQYVWDTFHERHKNIIDSRDVLCTGNPYKNNPS